MTKTDFFMLRVDRRLVDQMREVLSRHPLKPRLRPTMDKAIELMIEDLEEEIKNVRL